MLPDMPYEQLLGAGARFYYEESASSPTIRTYQEVTSGDTRKVESYLFQIPLHRSHLLRFLTHCSHICGKQTLHYTARASDGRDRIYADNGGGQSLPRKLRLLIYGSDHQELDIIGAFYKIVRRVIRHRFPNLLQLPPIGSLRNDLSMAFAHIPGLDTDVVKRIPSRVINSPPEEFWKWVTLQDYEIVLAPWKSMFETQNEHSQSLQIRWKVVCRQAFKEVAIEPLTRWSA